jgi:diaminohydroxyphosphoribosylaminopyrimidine deaminase / 5-amino-6-(5-phosphoribosylamino)uracil reductase
MPSDQEQFDRIVLGTAARVALKGRGFVEPNPTVGAVVVSGEGTAVAKGWHADYGGPHAELDALARAGMAARGGTLYVTLEPCSTAGKTPACTDAILAAGIRRVVVGALDPNPAHNGRGLDLLRREGIEVVHLPDDGCEKLIERFRRSLGRSRPWVILKWAMTLDGRIAARDGSSQWISGEKSRKTVHRLRGHVGGVMVGAGTMAADDPSLNCRARKAPFLSARIVIDPDLDTPPGGKFVTLAGEKAKTAGPAWVITTADADEAKAAALERAGAEIFRLDCDPLETDLFLEGTLSLLHEKGVGRLLVEGGAFLLTTFVEAGLADQVVTFVAPSLLGGQGALSPLTGRGAPSMKEAIHLRDVTLTHSGRDAMIVGFFS